MRIYLLKKVLNGLLVMAGVVVIVFFLFQGFGDPSRLVMGQTGDLATQQNIRKELYLDKPRWKQFLLYLNDVSPISIYSEKEIEAKDFQWRRVCAVRPMWNFPRPCERSVLAIPC